MALKKGKARKQSKSKKAKSAQSAGNHGRSLLGYFVPVIVLAGVVLALLALLGQQLLRSERSTIAEAGARQAAEAMAAQFTAVIDGTRKQLRLMAADPRVLAVVRASESRRAKVADMLTRAAPGFLQIRILPQGAYNLDPSGPAPLGFAGIDLIRRVQAGASVNAEVHQLKSRSPYVALAVPITSPAGNKAGVIFGALPLQGLIDALNAVSLPSAVLALMQGSDGDLVGLGPGAPELARRDGIADVKGTILTVAYRGQSVGGIDLGTLTYVGLAVAGILAVAFIAWLQSRQLGADLRADMGIAVTLGDALLRGEKSNKPQPRVRAVGETLMLLAQYTHQARSAGTVGPAPATPTGPRQIAAVSSAPQEEVLGNSAMVVEEVEDGDSKLANFSAMQSQEVLDAAVFRASDIRGRAAEDLDKEKIELLGMALGTELSERGGSQVAVGRDARLSSPALAQALTKGLTSSGCKVTDLGEVPTPLLYFARHELGVDGGVMVTGSHNSPEYNGFKIFMGDDMLAGEELTKLRQIMLSGRMLSGSGSVQQQDLAKVYTQKVTEDVALGRPFRVVIDAGNGVAGPLAVELLIALGCDVVPMNCEPDGRFPNHPANPSQPENMAEIAQSVPEQGADLGIALDGDGDRLCLVDHQGKLVSPDSLLMLLASDILVRHPGADVLYDVKSSRHLAGFILARGGRPIMWQSGHARMKAKLRETGALLAGGFSGQYFIKERWYGFDDGLYAAARILEILSADPRPCGEVFSEFPTSLATPELLLPLPEGQNLELMKSLAASMEFPEAKVVDIDGLRIEFADSWGLVRPSNTEPALMFRFEGNDQAALERVQVQFSEWVNKVQPALQLPF